MVVTPVDASVVSKRSACVEVTGENGKDFSVNGTVLMK